MFQLQRACSLVKHFWVYLVLLIPINLSGTKDKTDDFWHLMQAHPPDAINVQIYRLIKEWTAWDIARRAAFAFFGIFAGTEENPEFIQCTIILSHHAFYLKLFHFWLSKSKYLVHDGSC